MSSLLAPDRIRSSWGGGASDRTTPSKHLQQPKTKQNNSSKTIKKNGKPTTTTARAEQKKRKAGGANMTPLKHTPADQDKNSLNPQQQPSSDNPVTAFLKTLGDIIDDGEVWGSPTKSGAKETTTSALKSTTSQNAAAAAAAAAATALADKKQKQGRPKDDKPTTSKAPPAPPATTTTAAAAAPAAAETRDIAANGAGKKKDRKGITSPLSGEDSEVDFDDVLLHVDKKANADDARAQSALAKEEENKKGAQSLHDSSDEDHLEVYGEETLTKTSRSRAGRAAVPMSAASHVALDAMRALTMPLGTVLEEGNKVPSPRMGGIRSAPSTERKRSGPRRKGIDEKDYAHDNELRDVHLKKRAIRNSAKHKKKLQKNIRVDSKHYRLTQAMISGMTATLLPCRRILEERKLRAKPGEETKALFQDFDSLPKIKASSGHVPFVFKDYAGVIFARLRDLWGISDEAYTSSLACEDGFLDFIANSKSRSFFFYTADQAYMVKSMSKEENQFARTLLGQYYEHMMKYPNSLLTRIFGLHRVSLRKKKYYFFIMASVFHNHSGRPIHERFDLKGSWVGRKAKDKAKKLQMYPMLKDLDFEKYVLRLGPRRTPFVEQLRADVDMLRNLDVMDYSLLVGIHYRDRAERDRREMKGAEGALPASQPYTFKSKHQRHVRVRSMSLDPMSISTIAQIRAAAAASGGGIVHASTFAAKQEGVHVDNSQQSPAVGTEKPPRHSRSPSKRLTNRNRALSESSGRKYSTNHVESAVGDAFGRTNAIRALAKASVQVGMSLSTYAGPKPECTPGVLVDAVEERSAAAAGRLKVGDVIVFVDGAPVVDRDALIDGIERMLPGDALDLTVYREEATAGLHVSAENVHVRVIVRPAADDVTMAEVMRFRHKAGLPLFAAECEPDKCVAVRELRTMRKFLGLEFGGPVTAEGARVLSVAKRSPAKLAGVKAGDVIIAVNGRVVRDSTDIATCMASKVPGDTLDLLVDREKVGMATMVATIMTRDQSVDEVRRLRNLVWPEKDHSRDVAELGEDAALALQELRGAGGSLGLAFRSSEAEGLRVTRIAENSPAQVAGVRAGNVILELNGYPVADEERLYLLLRQSLPGDNCIITVDDGAGDRRDVRVVMSGRGLTADAVRVLRVRAGLDVHDFRNDASAAAVAAAVSRTELTGGSARRTSLARANSTGGSRTVHIRPGDMFVTDDGGTSSVVEKNDKFVEGNEVYYFGIIDILQVFNAKKKSEYMMKAITKNRKGISCVPPRRYAKRFLKFIESHVK